MMIVRRLILIVAAIGIAAELLRPQLSSALLTRGDTLAYWGHRDAAREAYARALLFDSSNAAAADRFVFSAATSSNSETVASGIRVATSFLAAHPQESDVMSDRAFCYQHLGQYARAASDFAGAGRIRRDPRALMFAALDERRLRQTTRARALLREAIAVDASFAPALRALKRLQG